MRPAIDYTALDFDALDRALAELTARNLPEYTDTGDGDFGVLFRQYVAYAAEVALYYQNRIAQNLAPATADDPEALTQLLRWIGYERRAATAASTALALGFAADVATPFTLPRGLGFAYAAPTGEIRFELAADVVVDGAALGPADPLAGNLRQFAPAPVIEGRTRTGVDIGAGDGAANLLLALPEKNVLAGTVALTVQEAGGPRIWRAVESLVDSGPADRHFTTRRDADGTVSVLFGDGVNGLIPSLGPPAAPTRVTAAFRVGGGPQGNIPADATLRCDDPAVRSARTIRAAGGGAAAEPLTRARDAAQRLFRAQDRAVSRRDVEDLALAVPGVGKARATAAGWNTVVLIVAPEGQIEAPSETLRAAVAAALEPRRLIGTELRIVGPTPVDVHVSARVGASPFAPVEGVRAAVLAAVERFFAFDAVAFGAPLYLSRLYDLIQSLDAVDFVFIDRFSRSAAGAIDNDGTILLAPWELPRPGARFGAGPGAGDPDRPPLTLQIGQGGGP